MLSKSQFCQKLLGYKKICIGGNKYCIILLDMKYCVEDEIKMTMLNFKW